MPQGTQVNPLYVVVEGPPAVDGAIPAAQAVVGTPASTATITTAAASVTTAALLALNTSRKGAVVYNEGPATAYVAFAATATLTAYTVQVVSGGYFEIPSPPAFTGALSVITLAGTATLRVTELT